VNSVVKTPSPQPIHNRNVEAGAVLIIIRSGAERFANGGEVVIKLSVEREFVAGEAAGRFRQKAIRLGMSAVSTPHRLYIFDFPG
jgi:hypothetical protein